MEHEPSVAEHVKKITDLDLESIALLPTVRESPKKGKEFVNDAELRSKAWKDVPKEAKEYYKAKLHVDAGTWNIIDRHPNMLHLDHDNKPMGETPMLENNLTFLIIKDKSEQECALLKLYNNQAVVLVHDLKISDEQLMQTCAEIMNNAYLDMDPKRVISIGKLAVEGDVTLNALELTGAMETFIDEARQPGKKDKSPIHGIKLENYNIHCKCNDIKLAKKREGFDCLHKLQGKIPSGLRGQKIK